MRSINFSSMLRIKWRRVWKLSEKSTRLLLGEQIFVFKQILLKVALISRIERAHWWPGCLHVRCDRIGLFFILHHIACCSDHYNNTCTMYIWNLLSQFVKIYYLNIFKYYTFARNMAEMYRFLGWEVSVSLLAYLHKTYVQLNYFEISGY